MKIRGSNINRILDQGIIAAHSGFPISWRELESDFLPGADVENLTRAHIAARERNLAYSFQELAANEREGKPGIKIDNL